MQSLRLKHAMIKLKPGFHMIATIAAIAEKKKNIDHMKPLSSDRSDRSDNNSLDIKSSISAIVVAAISREWFPYDR